ncbi:MAG TPA: heme-binding protein [Candidatus Limnocylindria bacterium]|nr:heme-binding protein [Candidatus Limnocylindria bacterium]
MPESPQIVDSWRGPTASQAAGLTLAAARRMIAAVEAEAAAMQVALSVAVVDSGDQLVAFARMDGADLVGVRLAQDKAYTALVNRMPTRDLAPLVQPGAEFYGYDSLAGGRMIVFAGGMPLERNGVLVGAIGVSGGSAEEDQRAVDAATKALGSA